MAAPAAGGFNVNQAAASGIHQAGLGASNEMGYKPMQVNPALVRQQGYDPATMNGVNPITANTVTGQGFDPSKIKGAGQITSDTVTGQGFNASTIGNLGLSTNDKVNAGQLAGSDLSAYTNPYEDQVVQQSLGDIERQRLMAQNSGGAQAGAANAFGGSRQGIAEAETNRAYAEQAAKTASGLRQSGYMNAQNQAGQDIGRTMQADLANQQAGMQSSQFNVGTDLQSQQANQAANMQANQFGASAQNQAALANQQSGMQAQQLNAGNTLAMQQANQAAQMQSGQFGASATNQAAMANQNANLQAQQATAGNTMNTQQANQSALNQAGQFGANAYNKEGQLNQAAMMQSQMANQQAGLQGSQQRLNAGAQLGNMSNLGFGMGQQVQNRMDQQGLAQQALQQQLINEAKGQYQGFTGAPQQSLQALLAAVGGAPNVGSQTQGYTPGLFDYLSLGAGMR